MRSYFVKTPRLVQKFFFNYSWRIKTNEKEIYLTFDDGPVPEFTPWVLETLEKFNAKATFFCVGENIKKHPHIYQEIKDRNHSIGNHTFNHLQGWKTPTTKYVKNILKAESYLQDASDKEGNKLFRPPHGRIRPMQAKILLIYNTVESRYFSDRDIILVGVTFIHFRVIDILELITEF